jgi:hypothetical protein
LVKLLRLAQVKSLTTANEFPEMEYWPEWNERFARPLQGVTDLHRPLTQEIDLASSLSHVEWRAIDSDYTIPLAGRRYRIARQDVRAGMKCQSLRVELRLEGTPKVRYEGRYVEIAECGLQAPAPPARTTTPAARAGGWTISGSILRRRFGGPSRSRIGRLELPLELRFGAPGKNGPAVFAFSMLKAWLGDSTKAIDLGSTIPSWHSGKTHGLCVPGGHPPIASEPTPSLRLWATAPGAAPARLIEHPMGGFNSRSKPELSTLR